ncbi:hypothetical protein BC833DRAFT_588807 [Globomyces pollinis-pini]|nr:hypothetical protein BC833DRAFT_588807 [Globomyces pollinis-pini]
MNSHRPSSAQLDQNQRISLANVQRPLSEQIPPSYKSSEAQAIDSWFEDLSYYERTLEEMNNTQLDDSFKDEMTAIENWFRVLSDCERTCCLFSLLKGTTPLQIRFFITVLSQMAAKDAHLDPFLGQSLARPGGRTSSISTSGSDDQPRLYARPTSNPRLSNDLHLMRSHSLLRPKSSDEFDEFGKLTVNSSPQGKMDQKTMQPSPTDWSVRVTQRTSSLQDSKSTFDQGAQKPPAVPATHLGRNGEPLNITPRMVGGSLPRPRTTENEEDKDTEKARLPDNINLDELHDIATWFRSLRLHKYTTIFENDDWRDLIKLDDEQLASRGVAAMGARRKMIRVFESIRAELEARGTPV